ncbi:heterokaryon incompatibility protein [Colletotrichum asianum]|uniref:Heterokaryon incompatibility protein n=1 Tax=Colletotrichum asianum TaxID=702518 RepID=A0A8H3WT75_9PEZI|nr:heterokaryon incompatibility protein [Colletotrichum asianum]
MPYCDFCAKLTVEHLVYQDIKFHHDLKSLKESAETGCDFCGLCWVNIEAKCMPQYLTELLNGERPSSLDGDQPWYPSIWLHGQIVPLASDSADGVWITCGRSRTSVDLGLSETNPPGSPLSIKLSSYAIAKSAAASIYPERCIAVDPDPDLYISFTLSRLRSCREKHARCARPQSLQMPTRVIEVGMDRQSRLRVTNGLCEPYVALSYCWGPSTDTIKLTHDTYDDFVIELLEQSLTKSHQEIIQFTRALGFKYLWVDALCIIQGDEEDWAFESRRMEHVYGNAALTVMAARSPDSREGFIKPLAGMKRQPCPIPLSLSSADVLYIDRPTNLSIGPTTTRGWCYQEEFLSKYTIQFAEEQIVYNCRTWSSWEDGTSKVWGSPGMPSPPVFPSTDKDVNIRREQTLTMWYAQIDRFTLRTLSNPHDVFAAIASIAKLAVGVLGSHYVAGLWEDDIARGLLWKPRHHVHQGFHIPPVRPQPTRLAPPPVVRAPSWSWASVEGPIHHQHTGRKFKDFEKPGFIKIKPRLENNRWTVDAYCNADTLHMPHCELSLIGHVAKASVMNTPTVDYVSSKQRNWWKYW